MTTHLHRISAWLNTRPSSMPLGWTLFVFGVIVLISAPPQAEGWVDLRMPGVPWLDL